jgi:translocation and assembly module TamB
MRTLWRIFRLLLLLVVLGIALVVGAAAVLTLTDKGRETLAGLASSMASSEDSAVSITGISGIWSGPLRIDSVAVSDKSGHWLAIRGVAIDWSPLRLINSTFRARLVHADRVELARLPQSSSKSSGGGLPVSLAIDRIDLPEVAIGGALAGEVAQVSASGSLHAEAEPLNVRADLNVTRSDGRQGAVDASIDFAPSENRLAIDLHGSEPAGGIIANLLKLPGAPPVGFAVSTRGPAADWDLSGTFSVAGSVVTRVTGKRQLTDKGNRIEATGDGEFERFVPKAFSSLLAGQSSFEFAGMIGDGGEVDIERAALESGALTASAKGTIYPAGVTDLAIEAAARGPVASLKLGEGTGAVTLDIQRAMVRAFGRGAAPALDVSASLAKVTTSAVELREVEAKLHSDAFELATRSGPLTLALSAASGSSAEEHVAALLPGVLKLDASVTLAPDTVHIESGSFVSDATKATVAGDVSLADGSLDLDVNADLPASLLPEQVRFPLGSRVAIATRLGRDAAGALTADRLSLKSGALDAAGRVAYGPQALDLALSGSFADLVHLSSEVGGKISFDIAAKGSPAAPDVTLTVNSDKLTAAGREISAVELSASGKADMANPALTFAVKGTMAGETLGGRAALKTTNGQRQIEDLSLTLGPNSLNGNLVLDEKFLPAGALAFALPDIGQLAKLVPEEASGVASGTAHLSVADGVPQIAIVADAPAVHRGDVSLNNARIEAVVRNYLVAPVVSGKATAGSVTSGATVASNVDLSLKQDGAWITFSAGGSVNGIEVKAAGRALPSGTTTIELSSASAQKGALIATLAQPTTIVVKDGTATLDRVTLAVNGGLVEINGRAGSAVDVTARLTTLPANIAEAVAPGVKASGSLSGSAHISRAADQTPNIAADLAADGAPAAVTMGEGDRAVTLALKSATARAVGSGATPAVDITVSLDKIATAEAEISGVEAKAHSDAFDIANHSGPLTVSLNAASGGSVDERVAGLLAGALKLDAVATLSPTGIHINSGNFASDSVKASVAGDASIADGSLKLDVKADVLAALLPAAARPALAKTVALAATVNRDAAGAVRLDPLTIKSGALDAAGSAAYAPAALDVRLQGGLADISKLSPRAAGAIGFEISAKGGPAAPDVSATVSSSRLMAAGREITGLALTVNGKADMANPSASVSLTGNVAGETLAGQAALNTANGERRIEGLSLTLGPNKINGDLVLDQTFVPEGTLSLDLPDIAPLAALAFDQASGAANGTVRFSRTNGVPEVAIDAKAASIVRGDLSVEGAEVTAQIANYLAAPAASGKVKAATVRSGGTVVRNLDLSLSRDGSWTGFLGGASLSGIDTTATGRVALANGTTTVELGSASAKLGALTATLAQPATITVKDAAATLDHLQLAVAGGTVEVTGSAGQQLDLDILLGRLPVSLAQAFAPGLEASGTLSGSARITRAADQGMNLGIDVAADGPPAALKVGEGNAAVSLALSRASLHAAGVGSTLDIDATASLDRLVTSQAELAGVDVKVHSDAFDLSSQSGPVVLSVTAASGGSTDERVAEVLAGALKLDAAATVSPDKVHIDSGSFASDSVKATVAGEVSLADLSLKLDARADLIAGLLPAAARSALASNVTVQASVSRDAGGALRVDGLSLASGAFAASGSVAYASNAVDARLQGGFADVSKLSPDAAGAIGFEITATGSPTAPKLAATITSDRLTAAGRDITGFELSASGLADLANPAASVSIKGNVAGQPLAGQAVLKTENGERRIDGLTLTLGANTLKGDLTLNEAMVPEGALAFTLPDIGPLAALAFEKASGAVSGSVRFSRAGGAPQVAVDARAASIVRGDLSVGNAEVSALVADYLAAPVVSGKAKAATVKSGGTAISNVDLTLTRDGSWTGFSGSATVNGIDVQAAGRAAIAAGTSTVELASASARMKGLVATLARPTTVSVKDAIVTLDRLALSVGGGTVQVNGTAGEQLNLDVQLSAVPASIADAFAPGLQPSGSIGGSVRVSGAAANPNIGYQLEVRDAGIAQTREAGFGAMAISSTGTFSQRVLKFTANIGDASGLSLKGGGSVDTAGNVLSVDVAGQVPFGFLARRLAEQGLALSGSANVSLNVRGSLSSPAVSGSITASGARLVDARSGLAVEGIEADIVLASGTATLRRLTGRLSGGGSLSGSGTVGIDAAQGFPANLAVKISDARYTDGRIVTANLSGDIALKGPLMTKPLLSGTINLAKTVITVPDRLPGSAAALNVKHKNASAAVRRQSAAIRQASATGSGNTGSGLTLDLTLNAPEEIFVRGRGLDAELGGSVHLTGPLSSPGAVGEFTLKRGRLTVLARRLDFTRGTVGFSGSLIPTLDFAAESVTGDATVTVGVTGVATDPKFTFTSVPPLPQDEVLARLIFGRSLSNLSPIQIAQLADAAAQLAGGGGSSSLFERVRRNLGVDNLDVRTDSRGGTSIAAGKYLNDRTYLSVQQGDRAGSTKATIDLNVGRGVKLRGEAGADGSAKGGIFYEREY